MSPGPGRLDSVTRRRLFLSPLLLLVALLTGLGLNTSSASASAGPETRVRAINHVPAISVGNIDSETPGRVGYLRPETGQVMSGSCVATEAGAGLNAEGGVGAAEYGPQMPGGPKSTPNFKPPTNPAQMPPGEIPPGWRIREMPPTAQYPEGYWKLEKPMPNGGWQPIDPSTMKPGGRPETHVPFPPGG